MLKTYFKIDEIEKHLNLKNDEKLEFLEFLREENEKEKEKEKKYKKM
jgi:hypothetical protein